MANLILDFKKKTSAEFAALSPKKFGTFYLVTDDNGATGDIYVGDSKISNAADLTAAVSRIASSESAIAALQELTTKLDGAENVTGSIRQLIAEAETAINEKIGTIPTGKTLVELINEGGTEVTELEEKIGTIPEGHTIMGDIAANASAIATLNGDAQTAGSVQRQVNDAIAAVVASAPSDFDTLKEISDWIGTHASTAAEMNSQILANASAISANTSAISVNASAIAANASAISAHETFVGASLPASTSATTVIGYVEESFQACETKMGSIPSTASASTIVDYVNEQVLGNQLYWSED